ncbi:hypothetical protein DPX16_16761 [Anabarilius grahami]|uniref:Uncharacterized protein n=1 Tax=Anabarilius grahami TaxID=495550 RepID=A0A3N0YSK5_ANAGA|nr:hypothetical protein DPX16_16761 [Anabarilius grahami]
MGPGSERVGCLKDFCTCVCVRWEEKGYCAPTNVFLSHLDSFLITSLNLKVFGMKPESGSPEAFYHEHSGLDHSDAQRQKYQRIGFPTRHTPVSELLRIKGSRTTPSCLPQCIPDRLGQSAPIVRAVPVRANGQ